MTLVELVIVIVVASLALFTASRLTFQGVQTFVFLPRAVAVNETASEALQQITEGGFSTLASSGGIIRGLRFVGQPAVIGADVAQPSLWLAEDNRLGYLNSQGQYVMIWRDAATELIRRGLALSGACPQANPAVDEVLPYSAEGRVRILTTGALFRYYNQSGALLSPAPGCLTSAVRRVDVSFTVQTSSGAFAEGQAQESAISSVALRVP